MGKFQHLVDEKEEELGKSKLVFPRDKSWLGVFYDGITNEHGEGGPLCMNAIPHIYKVYDTIGWLSLGTIGLSYLISSGSLYNASCPDSPRDPRTYFCFIALSFLFMSQVYVKIQIRQMFYMLNMCHIILATQIFLLGVEEKSPLSCFIFTLMFHSLFLPQLAICVPHLSEGASYFEHFIYWAEHLLILYVVPPYLMLVEGYQPYPYGKTISAIASLSSMFFYYFAFVQPIGWKFQMNICFIHGPTPGDPFFKYTALYRLIHTLLHILLAFVFPSVYLFLYDSIFAVL